MDGVDHGAVRDLDVDEVTSPCLISATIGARGLGRRPSSVASGLTRNSVYASSGA